MLLLKDKRGDFTGVLYMVVMLSAFAIFLLIAGFIATEIAGEVKTQLNSTSDDVNEAFDATTNTARNTLSTLWYIMFGGITIRITCNFMVHSISTSIRSNLLSPISNNSYRWGCNEQCL